MAKVFVSFLGIGRENKSPGYDKAHYRWEAKSTTTVHAHFAQTAILKILEETAAIEGPVDRVIFLCTKESRDKHLEVLQGELRQHLISPPRLIVPEPLVPTSMTEQDQWQWFEQLLSLVEQNDTLIIDFTHGMRVVPIVFSSAIGFLQRAKGVSLAHALYGWYDQKAPDQVHPIVDLQRFYVINDWAEAVARLADDADARKLCALSQSTEVASLRPLADEGLNTAFTEMTDCIRNVDVNNVSTKVHGALDQVEKIRAQVDGSARLMLDLVWTKFTSLAAEHPPSGRYDLPYFRSQLAIIRVLLEHRLFMQAFTAMRELVGSLGMIGLTGKYHKKMTSADGKKYRRRFAETFINMMQFPQDNWNFTGQNEADSTTLMPWLETLKKIQAESQLRVTVQDLIKTRNGFDHAWTAQKSATSDIETQGMNHLHVLENIINNLAKRQLLT
jgi:CRISPR-associated Csx2 family protein